MSEVQLHRLSAHALVGRVPIAGTHATFAVAIEPERTGVGFRFGWLVDQDQSLLLCHSTGTRETKRELVNRLRAAVDQLEAQLI